MVLGAFRGKNLTLVFPPSDRTGSGIVCAVGRSEPFPELLPELLPRCGGPPARRRASVAAQEPQAPQPGPRQWRQHGVGEPDAQWAVEEHRLGGPELLPLHHTMVCVRASRLMFQTWFVLQCEHLFLFPVRVWTRWWRNTASRKSRYWGKFQSKRASRWSSSYIRIRIHLNDSLVRILLQSVFAI